MLGGVAGRSRLVGENGFTYQDSAHNLTRGNNYRVLRIVGHVMSQMTTHRKGLPMRSRRLTWQWLKQLAVPALILLPRNRFRTLEVQDNVQYEIHLNSTRVTSIVLNSFLGDAATRSARGYQPATSA